MAYDVQRKCCSSTFEATAVKCETQIRNKRMFFFETDGLYICNRVRRKLYFKVRCVHVLSLETLAGIALNLALGHAPCHQPVSQNSHTELQSACSYPSTFYSLFFACISSSISFKSLFSWIEVDEWLIQCRLEVLPPHGRCRWLCFRWSWCFHNIFYSCICKKYVTCRDRTQL